MANKALFAVGLGMELGCSQFPRATRQTVGAKLRIGSTWKDRYLSPTNVKIQPIGPIFKRHITSKGSTADPGSAPDRERVVILGSGWGGYTLSRRLSPSKFYPTVVSPRSYFVFTPLLTDAAAGSLNFSEIVEPVRDRKSQVHYIQAAARSVDFNKKTVMVEACVVKSGVTESPRVERSERETDQGPQIGNLRGKEALRKWEAGQVFEVPYDKLVIAVGCVSRTFNTSGVRQNAMFFKDIGDAKRVKRRVRECFELAVMPTTSFELRKNLLHFAIVGAGPTGTELAAALCDFLHDDMFQIYPKLKDSTRITLYDVAPKVLSMFDKTLSDYAMTVMSREGVEVKTNHHIQELRWGEPHKDPAPEMDPKGCLTLKTKEGGEEGVGMCVWATGNEMNKFVNDSLGPLEQFPTFSALFQPGHTSPNDPKSVAWKIKKAPKTGALLVDNHLRVQLESEDGRGAVMQDVFALGDNCMLESDSPPATAQATNQEACWLAKRLNKGGIGQEPGFSFKNFGMIAYLGSSKALMQIPSSEHLPKGIKGRTAWLIWKGAYLTMSLSWRNRLRILYSWMSNWAFGRDISRY
uniref:External NADH-ubiquinone oxidoreductase 2 n=1 Tax=Coccidioides posadasii RMSCC 3488 TaxID=454284 RepID=A0A0J6FQ14_COCPO|nr:external NADH-ubiquinone oxidoreductase 2 [Coccidioides posadasii RMSCC 3488]